MATVGLTAISMTMADSMSVRNHTVPSNSASCVAMGRQCGLPSLPVVTSIAVRMSLISSATL
jgi:hypothetical protein